jgi:hypothetical protein
MAGRRAIGILALSAKVERKSEDHVELEGSGCVVFGVFRLDCGGLQIGP